MQPGLTAYVRPTSQMARNTRTTRVALRRTAPWTPEEDAELEAFAARWSRTFDAVAQRRRWPRVRRRGQGECER